MENKIHITELANPCITRERGKEAVNNLRKYMKDNSVLIDLNNVEILSMSFLDEFIFWLAGSAVMRKVVFLVNEPTVYDKLARIAAIRNVWVYYRDSNNENREISPKKSISYKAKFMPLKM